MTKADKEFKEDDHENFESVFSNADLDSYYIPTEGEAAGKLFNNFEEYTEYMRPFLEADEKYK